MQAETILEIMRNYFIGRQPEEILTGFSDRRPTDLLTESLDVVDFVLYLEEELGLEVDVNRIGPALSRLTFGELAPEISRLAAGGG